MDKIIILGLPVEHEPCAYCGEVSELRPYGRGGAKICYKCGMLPENIETSQAAVDRFLAGESVNPTPDQSN